MSERLIHLPVLLAAVLAARALDRLSALSRPVLWTCAVALLLLNARNVRFERELLLAAAREPDLALAREMARQIERVRAPGQCVTVLAPPVGAALLDAYVAKVGAGFGNVERARERAVALAGMSPDRDRIAAQLTAPLGTVRAGTGCPLLVLVDVPLSGIGGGEPPEGTLVAEVTAGSRRAVLLRTRR